MYAYIKGEIADKAKNYVIIEAGGIGYKILMSTTSIDKLPNIGAIQKIYTHYHVTEDNISLYGFIENEELRMFELLLSVSGIGAKSAIQILSNITPASFALAVITNDISQMTKLPGVGKKTAARIILDLQDKLKTEETIMPDNATKKVYNKNDNAKEASAALQVLGYTTKEIEKVLENIDLKNLSIEEIIKKSLSYLGR